MPLLDIQEIRDILPHRYPMLLVDSILELEEERIVGIKNVTVNEPFFVGHFPEYPVMPGVLVVEAMAQVAGVLVLKSLPDRKNKLVLLATIEEAKFRGQVRPGDQLRIEMKVTKRKATIAKMHGAGHRGRSGGGRSRADVRAAGSRAARGSAGGRRAGAGSLSGAWRSIRLPSSIHRPGSPPALKSGRLHHRRRGGDRSPHAPDGARVRGRRDAHRRRQHLLSVFDRRSGVAGSEIQRRARRDAHREPEQNPRICQHPSRHRKAAAWSPKSATTIC